MNWRGRIRGCWPEYSDCAAPPHLRRGQLAVGERALGGCSHQTSAVRTSAIMTRPRVGGHRPGAGSCLTLTRRSTMSKHSLPDPPAEVKPEPRPHPLVVKPRRLRRTIAERDRLAAAQLARMSRRLDKEGIIIPEDANLEEAARLSAFSLRDRLVPRNRYIQSIGRGQPRRPRHAARYARPRRVLENRARCSDMAWPDGVVEIVSSEQGRRHRRNLLASCARNGSRRTASSFSDTPSIVAVKTPSTKPTMTAKLTMRRYSTLVPSGGWSRQNGVDADNLENRLDMSTKIPRAPWCRAA